MGELRSNSLALGHHTGSWAAASTTLAADPSAARMRGAGGEQTHAGTCPRAVRMRPLRQH